MWYECILRGAWRIHTWFDLVSWGGQPTELWELSLLSSLSSKATIRPKGNYLHSSSSDILFPPKWLWKVQSAELNLDRCSLGYPPPEAAKLIKGMLAAGFIFRLPIDPLLCLTWEQISADSDPSNKLIFIWSRRVPFVLLLYSARAMSP